MCRVVDRIALELQVTEIYRWKLVIAVARVVSCEWCKTWVEDPEHRTERDAKWAGAQQGSRGRVPPQHLRPQSREDLQQWLNAVMEFEASNPQFVSCYVGLEILLCPGMWGVWNVHQILDFRVVTNFTGIFFPLTQSLGVNNRSVAVNNGLVEEEAGVSDDESHFNGRNPYVYLCVRMSE